MDVFSEGLWAHPDATRMLTSSGTPSSLVATASTDEVSLPALMSIVPHGARVEDLPWDEVDDALRSIESDTGTLGAVLTATPSYVTSLSEASRLSGGIAPLRPHSKVPRPTDPLPPSEANILPDDERNEALASRPRRGSTASKTTNQWQRPTTTATAAEATSSRTQPALPPTPIGADLELTGSEPPRKQTKETGVLQAPAPLLPLLPGEFSTLSTEFPPVARRNSLEPFAVGGAPRHGSAPTPTGARTPPSRATGSPSHTAQPVMRRHVVSANAPAETSRTPPPGGLIATGVAGTSMGVGTEPPTYAQTMQSAIYPSQVAPTMRSSVQERAAVVDAVHQGPVHQGAPHRGAGPVAATMPPHPNYVYPDPTPGVMYVMGTAHQPAAPSHSPNFPSPIVSGVSPVNAAQTGGLSLVSPLDASLSLVFQQPPAAHNYFPSPLNQQLASTQPQASQLWHSAVQLNRMPPVAQYVQAPFSTSTAPHFVTSGTIPFTPQQYVAAATPEPVPPTAPPSGGVTQVIFWRP